MHGYQLKQFLYITLILISALGRLAAQSESKSPHIVTQTLPILFAASQGPPFITEEGQPALATIEPIAFIGRNNLYGCFQWDATNSQISETMLSILRKAYTPGNTFPLYWRGVRFGSTRVVHSCIEEEEIKAGGDVVLQGCVLHTTSSRHSKLTTEFSGIAFTGKPPVATHPAMREKANESEAKEFIAEALKAFASKGIDVKAESIQVGTITKTEVRAGHLTLTGDLLAVLHADRPGKYYFDRMLLAIEETNGVYVTILVNLHIAQALFDGDKTTEELKDQDEENEIDHEIFVDNFPLFIGEADAIITQHIYYESFEYSIYRRKGTMYELIYTNCGGGT